MSDCDGLAGSDEAVEVAHRAVQVAEEPDCYTIRDVLRIGIAAAAPIIAARVRAEAVAEERQQIASAVADVGRQRHWMEEAYDRGYREAVALCVSAAGSVPVATPEPANPTCEHGRTGAHPVDPTATQMFWREYPPSCPGPVATPVEPPARCGEKRSQSSAGAYWLNAEQYDSVALCCDEPAGHAGDHRCDEGKPGHDTWPNDEARSVAEPSVGTGTPAEEVSGLEDLPVRLFSGANRYDTDSTHVLHLWTEDGQSYDLVWPKLAPAPVPADLLQALADRRSDGAFITRIRARVAADRHILDALAARPVPALKGDTAEAVSGGSGHAERQEGRPVEIASLPIEELPDWTDLAEAVGATLHNREAGCSGEYETEMRWPDGRVATNRDRLAIISADSELPPVEWQIVFERMHANHDAEVARYRAAIEAARDELDAIVWPGQPTRTRVIEVQGSLAAALGDGAR